MAKYYTPKLTEARGKAMNGEGVLEKNWHLAYDKETMVGKNEQS